jgi:hypothetical protein
MDKSNGMPLYSQLMGKQVTHCRVCGIDKFSGVLDLGMMPLANNLERDHAGSISAKRYHLNLISCDGCGHLQLSTVIDPETLYSFYVYRSGISDAYKKHCLEMAQTIKERFSVIWGERRPWMVDIAGNDGTLISEFRKVTNYIALNVDPAANLSKHNYDAHVKNFARLWTMETAQEIYGAKDGKRGNTVFDKADIITATNVFAHVDDVHDFMAAVRYALADKGVCIIEVPHVLDFLEGNEFDTIYFEHLSYFSLGAIFEVAMKNDLQVFDVSKHDIHGGTLRVYIGHTGAHDSNSHLGQIMMNEYSRLSVVEPFFEKAARLTIKILCDTIRDLKSKGARIAAFAASAKGNTLLNACKLSDLDIEYIVDDTPEKQGKYSPGTGLEIVSRETLYSDPPDYLLVLAWNFKDDIIKSLEVRFNGRFIIPIPNVEII